MESEKHETHPYGPRAYLRGEASPDEYGTPDAENLEWSDEAQKWSVALEDFGGDLDAAAAFISARDKLLEAAEAAGIPKDTFLPFEPSKPGFEERAKALKNLPAALGWAAE
ncbi:MAG: hypothetical protein AAF618_07620 [Pseudomonadota bacterium]